MGTRANGEFVDRESGVTGSEIGCVRGEGDVGLESCGSRGTVIAGTTVFRVAKARRAADAAALCVAEGTTTGICLLVGRAM